VAPPKAQAKAETGLLTASYLLTSLLT